jgi:NADH-quinone oxidoreductase subunit A
MPSEYIAIFVFTLLSVTIPMLALKSVSAGVAKRSARNYPPVESEQPVVESVDMDRMSHFYVIAVLVVVCDAAFVFLLPWAVMFESLGIYGILAMSAFIGVLAVGYLWIRNNGALDSV